MTKLGRKQKQAVLVSCSGPGHTAGMTPTTPLAQDTASALRLAFGPGYAFGGPSDRQFNVVTRNTRFTAAPRRR